MAEYFTWRQRALRGDLDGTEELELKDAASLFLSDVDGDKGADNVQGLTRRFEDYIKCRLIEAREELRPYRNIVYGLAIWAFKPGERIRPLVPPPVDEGIATIYFIDRAGARTLAALERKAGRTVGEGFGRWCGDGITGSTAVPNEQEDNLVTTSQLKRFLNGGSDRVRKDVGRPIAWASFIGKRALIDKARVGFKDDEGIWNIEQVRAWARLNGFIFPQHPTRDASADDEKVQSPLSSVVRSLKTG